MQSFVVWNDEINERLDAGYYYSLQDIIYTKIKNSKYPIRKMRELASIVTKGESPLWKGDSFLKEGIPFLRGKNIKEGAINFEDVVYISDSVHRRMRRSILSGNYLLLTMAGTLGDVAFFKKEYPECNINQDIAKIKLTDKILYEYATVYFQTALAKKQINILSNGGTRSHLNFEQIKSFDVILPPISVQTKIVDIMQSAYKQKKQKEAEAQKLLDSIDSYVLDELGIKLQEFEDKKCFVVDVEELSGILSPHFFVSKPKDEKGFVELKSIAEINPSRKMNNLELDTIVPYVGLPETDNFKVKNILERPYKEVKGRNIIKKGDILFARIEPSIFNKKYILVDDLKGYNYAFTSTEFYIVKARENVNLEFLFYMFYTTPVYNQVIGKTTGSTGRRRLDKGVFETLLIPLPPLEIQNKIAEEVKRRISEAETLRAEASKIIEEAKKQVEEMILGD
jgi:restriction endonuclease S subunit